MDNNILQPLLNLTGGQIQQYINGSGNTNVKNVFIGVFVMYIIFTLRNNLMPAIIVAGVVTVMYVFNKDKLVDMFQSTTAEAEECEEHKPGEVVPIEIYKVPVTDSTQPTA